MTYEARWAIYFISLPKYLQALGIAAGWVNIDQEPGKNKELLEQAQQGNIKILYIAPERQENLEWLEAVRGMKLSMVVIDEAHCISLWGHDFRPAFRRIIIAKTIGGDIS